MCGGSLDDMKRGLGRVAEVANAPELSPAPKGLEVQVLSRPPIIKHIVPARAFGGLVIDSLAAGPVTAVSGYIVSVGRWLIFRQYAWNAHPLDFIFAGS